jgi:quercetin dioxygenase-like cupin family protein
VRTEIVQCVWWSGRGAASDGRRTFIVLLLALTGFAIGLGAQQTGFKRTILQQADLSIAGREAVTAISELQPGASAAPHTHPGEEIGYVLEGTVVVEQEGKSPLTAGAGQAFLIPAGTVHGAKNAGSTTARILTNFIVEKGKPLATPVR